jgi:hypothetical protein
MKLRTLIFLSAILPLTAAGYDVAAAATPVHPLFNGETSRSQVVLIAETDEVCWHDAVRDCKKDASGSAKQCMEKNGNEEGECGAVFDEAYKACLATAPCEGPSPD